MVGVMCTTWCAVEHDSIIACPRQCVRSATYVHQGLQAMIGKARPQCCSAAMQHKPLLLAYVTWSILCYAKTTSVIAKGAVWLPHADQST